MPLLARRRRLGTSLVLAIVVAAGAAPDTHAAIRRTEVLVYGGTPAGVLAAVTASRAGAEVILLEPTSHLGGMMGSGLSWTDIGDKSTLGGHTREWFDRVQAIEGEAEGRYHFAPSSAELAFRKMLHTTSVKVHLNESLREQGGVTKSGARISSIRSVAGHEYRAATFIDASYSGDLMAAAGVTYRVGREAISEYGEPLAGARSPQVVLPSRGGLTLPHLSPAPGPLGTADSRIQDSNYRVCFSSRPGAKVAFTAPNGYDADDYALIARYLDYLSDVRGMPAALSWVLSISPLTDQKFDVNDFGAMSTAIPGLNWDYPEASYAERVAIDKVHRQFTQGLFFFLANDATVPASVRGQMATYGLCSDEFLDNDHWPRQLYLREGRRMVGAYVLRQSDLETSRTKPDIIGIASYRIDAHFVSRWIDGDRIMSEGSLSGLRRKYAIPYRMMVPSSDEARNLLVPVASSATHVAQSSLRMEPQYMLMGEAAGEAAAMTITRPPPSGSEGGAAVAGSSTTATPKPFIRRTVDVGKVDIARLQARLKAHGARLTNPS